MIREKKQLMAFACVWLLMAGGTSAQDDASYNKKFPDGSEVYLRKESFTELRSRLQGTRPELLMKLARRRS